MTATCCCNIVESSFRHGCWLMVVRTKKEKKLKEINIHYKTHINTIVRTRKKKKEKE
jgi:hypothetical protein